MGDPRDEFISEVVQNRSFADVGGLWGTESEKVSVAHLAGASSLAMIDIAPPEHDSWRSFTARLESLGVTGVRLISGDVVSVASEPCAPQFDVVHCSGVLYHSPNPMAILASLRKLARHHVILSSSVIGTHVATEDGSLDIPHAAAVFVPALAERERQIISSHWRPHVGKAAMGLTQPISEWRLDNHIAWWWLPSRHALKSMCEATGFVCEAEADFWSGNVSTLKLAVAPREPARPDGATEFKVPTGVSRGDELPQLRTRVAELEQDKALIGHELEYARCQLEASQAWIRELETAKTWLGDQRARWEREAGESTAQANARLVRIRELEATNAWLEEQRSNWERAAWDYSQRLPQPLES